MGCIGIDNFHNRNLSLLAKWIWRYLTVSDALVEESIPEHYSADGIWSMSVRNGSQKSPWKFIC